MINGGSIGVPGTVTGGRGSGSSAIDATGRTPKVLHNIKDAIKCGRPHFPRKPESVRTLEPERILTGCRVLLEKNY